MIAPVPSADPAALSDNGPHGLRRVLHLAYAFHPDASMESRNGWRRAAHAARTSDVTILYGDKAPVGLLRSRAEAEGIGSRMTFVPVASGPLGRRLMRSSATYYAGYRLWHRSAFQEAKRRHAERPFDLVHQTTYCGFREPGEGWRLGVPFVWGPVGGTQAFPLRFLGELSCVRSAWIELCRNAINAAQLRFSRRVRGASRRADVVLTATRRAEADFRQNLGVPSRVCLETAIDGPIGPPREPRDPNEPFRILWAGRLRPWKTLPLLLKALPLLPPELDYRVRVLGVGPCEAAWRKLAQRLGVADRIEWAGWPSYEETLPHYRWADAFAFTSLRDTSGTGLLEALAAATPIVAVDHQGAADIVGDDCGLRVPVDSPRQTVAGFATAITRLAGDAELWSRLSGGAQKAAFQHTWEAQAELLEEWYESALAAPPERAIASGRRPLLGRPPAAAAHPACRDRNPSPAV